jgi:hypothetical protein
LIRGVEADTEALGEVEAVDVEKLIDYGIIVSLHVYSVARY